MEPNTPNRDSTLPPNSFKETRSPEVCPPTPASATPAHTPAPPELETAGSTVPGTVEVIDPSSPTLSGKFSEVEAGSANGTGAISSGGPSIAGYEVLEELGRGGMGVVYKARQLSLKRLVALKMILATRTGPEALTRFRAEAETVARLQHPNIVQVYEIGEHNGLPFLSLEFVEGANLDTTLRATSLAPAQASELVRTLARAIHAAHEKGVIHRDLKPGNVLLQQPAATENTDTTERKRRILSSSVTAVASLVGFVPKITDFGLAKDLEEEAGQTREGSILGTPSYMSPEQAEGRIKDIGPWTDVYALGAILYECLTGRPPFKGQTAWDTLALVREREPVAPHHLQPSCPRDLETICLKCLRKEATARYQSAAALADDLDRFLTGQPITARPVGVVTRAVKWARRHPASAALVVVLVLAAAGLAAAIPLHVARLETAVEEAKEEVLRLRDREQRAGVRADGQRLLREGQEALARGSVRDLQEARALFAGARDRITDSDAGQDPTLKELREDAGRRLAEAERRLKQSDDAAKAEKMAREFFELRDQAFFQLHQDLVAGPDTANPEVSQITARKALALFGVTQAQTVPPLDAYSPAKKKELTDGLYEVLLILAEAVGRPLPGQPDDERRKQAGAALAILEQAEALVPGTPAVPRRRARFLIALGREAKAAEERARAAQLQPRTPLDWFLVGYDAWFEEGNIPKALRAFDEALDQALRLRQDLFWAEFLRALGHQKLGNRSEALASLTVCSRVQPDFVWIYLLRGFLHGDLGDARAAEDDFKRAEKLIGRNEFARYVLHMHRGVLAMRRQRALGRSVLLATPLEALRRDEVTRAMDEFQAAIRLKPDLYHGYVNLAEAYRARHEPGQASEQLDRAIRRGGKQPGIYRTLAALESQRGNYAAALDALDEAIRLELKPQSVADDHLERGYILFGQKRYAEVLQACSAALAARSDRFPAAHALRARVLLKREQWKEAVVALDRALADGGPNLGLFLQRAEAHGKLDDYPALVDDYTGALAFRKDARLYTARGWAYLVNESPKLAQRDFDAALRLDPKSGDAHNGRGFARARLGDHRGADADARAALDLGPREPRMLYNAARTYAQAVAAIEANPAERNRRGLELRSSYEDRALGLLRETLNAVPPQERQAFWRDKVERDPALKPIRPTPGFRRLAEEFSRQDI